MNERPKILILTLSFGAGHVRAAQAVAARLKIESPQAEIRLVDALENCPVWFRAFYVWTYWAMIRYAPRVWEKFFNSRVERKDEQTAPVWMWKKGCRKVFAEIKNFQPDLIVAAEVGACEIAVIARRGDLTNAPVVSVITDYEAEPIWVKPEIAAFCAASEEVKIQLQNWGAKAEKIQICGIPIDADFAETFYAANTRKEFDLDERPIILLMGGGMGPSRMDEIARLLVEKGENLNVVALPGRDRRAAAQLGKLQDSPTVSLRVLGWTNRVAALMRAAEILATKPGGLTLAEAAAAEIPCVLFDQIPGPEAANVARFVKGGAAFETRNSEETVQTILNLLSDNEKLAQMKTNARRLAEKDATGKIARLILETVKVQPARENAPSASPRMANYRRAFAVWQKIDEKAALNRGKKV